MKINAVSIDLINGRTGGKEGKQLAFYSGACQALSVDVRFIEIMPIGYGKQFKTIDHRTLLFGVQTISGLKRTVKSMVSALRFIISHGFQGSIGLISAVHRMFCSSCNRVRLTAGGYLKTCLCYEDGIDLRAVLREGIKRPEEESRFGWPDGLDIHEECLQRRLQTAMEAAILKKPRAHCFETPGRITESHNMSSIGG